MEFANNTGNTVAEIFVASGGGMNIQNKSAGNIINLQTANTGTGALVTQLTVAETSIIAIDPLDTREGIIGPVASLSYTSDMIGYAFTFTGTAYNSASASPNTFASGSPVDTTTTTPLSIGVWLVVSTQVLIRGNGAFTVASITVQSLSLATGTGTIYSPGVFRIYLPNGATAAQVNNSQTATIQVTSAATITIRENTTMTVGSTSSRASRVVFTRIA
jgi:hypothetical protein